MQDYIELHYEISGGDFLRAGEASSDIKKMLMKLGINSPVLKRVCIACYEAEMNIVIHSFGGCIDALIYEDKITIVAWDRGPGINDIELALMEGYSTAPEVAREMGFGAGMGLPNIKRSCNLFSINSKPGDSTTVTMVINLK
jgi:serine/threonine-protein kinase RsbT